MIKDILVKTDNPDGLDKILNQYGAALVGGGMPTGYVKVDDYIRRYYRTLSYLSRRYNHSNRHESRKI